MYVFLRYSLDSLPCSDHEQQGYCILETLRFPPHDNTWRVCGNGELAGSDPRVGRGQETYVPEGRPSLGVFLEEHLLHQELALNRLESQYTSLSALSIGPDRMVLEGISF